VLAHSGAERALTQVGCKTLACRKADIDHRPLRVVTRHFLAVVSATRSKSLSAWLFVGVLFYLVDCFVATLVDKTSLYLPWFERGIYAGGPFGILLTVAWLVFPVRRLIYKRIKTRPRD
jgi:hypothetical protein